MPFRSRGMLALALSSSAGSVAAIRRAAVIALVANACAAGTPAAQPVGRETTLDAATEDRILALVPESISARDVGEVLSQAPAPRIISLQGSVPVVTMAPFAEFLVAMGYPRGQLTNPDDGSLTYSSFVDARQLAGALAWYYEREGMIPMLIGHSQGGMIAIRVLHELSGDFGDALQVWNPLRKAGEDRMAIVDPLTGAQRPVLGLKVGYVAVLATGTLPRLLLGQWSMLSRLREIPDTVEEFTGFSLEWDPIAGNFGTADTYRATGSARVRNVTLPRGASHITLPQAQEYALNPITRDWIDRYVPGPGTPELPTDTQLDVANLLHAADIWYSVKKHWCIEAQELIRGRRRQAVPLQ
ncbi:MAG TPA: hypothetical protein VG425_13585 [Casimicrobiaceae bacterium]|nr:hypothetical protein [Casimicrobiaceae bacterium]